MRRRRDFDLFLRVLMCITAFVFSIGFCMGGDLSESESLFNFIRSIDPENTLKIQLNKLSPTPCSNHLVGVKCNLRANSIIAIRLENMNLSGVIDSDSLCKLQNLTVLSLAKNRVQGSIPNSILRCTSLVYLNLSNNLMNGSVPMALTKLKNLKRVDISNNHFTGTFPNSSRTEEVVKSDHPAFSPESKSSIKGNHETHKTNEELKCLPLILGIAAFFLLTYFMNKKATEMEMEKEKEKEILKLLSCSPDQKAPAKALEEVIKGETRGTELVFFVEEEESFKLDDLLEAAADLQGQSLYSSLYRVMLKNNSTDFAVKRLKKLQVSFEEFGHTMRMIGKLKHQNILSLVGYNSTSEEEKLIIYKYQRNGSLFALFENYIEGKREFPWKLRLSIAVGIARGLDAIYRSADEGKVIPHGNIKLSNILLNENEEPLISEYGYSKFLDPKTACLFNSNGYTAPEKSSTEQGDVYSFGVILLELLTGKVVEKCGLDLPKWVKSMVREEWTGEVFDKEVAKVGLYAFPLLNISLKCVAHFPEHRPFICEVLEKIEEVVNAQDDFSPSFDAPIESNQ